MNNNISFKSTFRPVKGEEFAKLSSAIPRELYVDFPWTVKESVNAVKACTTGVADCSVLGVTDGSKVLMLHLCPTIDENSNLDKIKNFILNKIKIGDENLQAVLLGSQIGSEKSVALFNFLKNLMDDLKIPCSYMQHCKDYFNVLYSSQTDEWCISSKGIACALTGGEKDNRKIFNNNFKKVQISNFDEIA